jgi:two-component system sensor histidine kinase TctE
VTVGVLDSPCPELYVEDQGPGIAPSEREKVVDRFYRVPGTPGDGCGLGLAIVKEIAGLSGASFRLESGTGGTGLRARLVFDAGRASSKPTATAGGRAPGDARVVPDWTH